MTVRAVLFDTRFTGGIASLDSLVYNLSTIASIVKLAVSATHA